MIIYIPKRFHLMGFIDHSKNLIFRGFIKKLKSHPIVDGFYRY
ncbi:hypothetical protein X278_03710 [Oenococcus oeni IOEB_0205]|nr:hypothetical protein X278_03710 [Oenococcus oeni IOEB_0205]